MIKASHSNSQHWVLLEISSKITVSEIYKAKTRLSCILQKMNHGYTLIEAFRGESHLDNTSAQHIGSLIQACYKPCRIWAAIRVYLNGSDPGLIIAHRSRWGRRVPELEANDLPSALVMAQDEVRENNSWL